MSGTQFARWSAPESLVSVDYSTVVMEHIRQLPKTEKTLSGMVPLGWFVSHTRSVGVSMTAQDQEIFSKFFPDRWDVTLVLRPGRMGVSRAGFFTRDADGGVKIDAPYREF